MRVISGCSNVVEGCWRKTCMLVKTNFFFKKDTFHQHTEKFSPTYFTNIHLNFCSKFSPTYSTFHQHTEFFSPTYFTNIHLNFCLHQHTASPTYFFSPTYFTNITTVINFGENFPVCWWKYQHTISYIFTNIQVFHQQIFFTNIFHQDNPSWRILLLILG